MHNPKASLAVTAVIKILPAPALLFVAGWHLATYEPHVPCWSCREKPGSCRNSCRLQHVARCAGFLIIPHYMYVFEACSYFGRQHAV